MKTTVRCGMQGSERIFRTDAPCSAAAERTDSRPAQHGGLQRIKGALRATIAELKEACQGLPTAAQETKILQKSMEFCKEATAAGYGILWDPQRKPR